MIIPKPLKAGDTVALIATARKVSAEEMISAKETLRVWGLNVVEGRHLYAQENQFAGSDALRMADFQQALNNADIKAILFARGGYGTVRIIDHIDFAAFQKNPKWLIGFSDITTVHSHLHTQYKVATLHAPMAINFSKSPKEVLLNLRDLIFGKPVSITAPLHHLNRNGSAQGVLVGGNLSMLYSLAASDSDIQTKNKILFLEDLDEYLYHIDRMMMQLKRSGKLANLAGLIVGGMTDMKDNTIPFGKTAEEIIAEHVAEYAYPVCFGFPAGHLSNNQPLVLGALAQLHVDEKVTLKSPFFHSL